MTAGKLDVQGMGTLVGTLMQTATPEAGGTFTCEQCALFYSHAKSWEAKYHCMARLFVRAAWSNIGAINPKTGRSYGEDFQLIDGRSVMQYVEDARKEAQP